MAISVTSLGGASATTAVSIDTVNFPVPANVLAVTATNEYGATAGTVADSASNSHSLVTSKPDGSSTVVLGLFYFNNNATTLSSITYTAAAGAVSCRISGLYATGVKPSSALDGAVTNSAAGSGTSPQTASVVSGTPAEAGELFVAAVTARRVSGSNVITYGQDSGHGWATPFDNNGGSQGGVYGGNQVNSGSGQITFAPTLTGVNDTIGWASIVAGFKAVPPAQDIAPTKFSNSNTLTSPSRSMTVDRTQTKFTNASTLTSPSRSVGPVNRTLTKFTNASTLTSPSRSVGAVNRDAPKLTNAPTFYTPTRTPGVVNRTAPKLTITPTFYAPTRSVGSVNRDAPLHTESVTFHAPTLQPGAVDRTQTKFDETITFYAPSRSVGAVDRTLTKFDEAATLYSPTRSMTVNRDQTKFDNSSTYHAPTVEVVALNIAAPKFDEAVTFYGPTFALTVNRTQTLFSESPTFYAPTRSMTVGRTQTRFDETVTFYAPGIGKGAVDRSPAKLTESPTFHTPGIGVGAVNRTLTLFASGAVLHSPALAQFGTMRPDGDAVGAGWRNQDDGTELFSAIDEEAADDGDYIKSGASLPDACTVTMANPGIGVVEPVTVRYRYWGDAGGLVVRLKEGASVIATSGTLTPSEAHTDGEFTLTTLQFNAVSDWNAVTLEFEATA